MADKDVLSNMFSSFVTRKTRTCSPQISLPMSPPTTSLHHATAVPLLPNMASLSAAAADAINRPPCFLLNHPNQRNSSNIFTAQPSNSEPTPLMAPIDTSDGLLGATRDVSTHHLRSLYPMRSAAPHPPALSIQNAQQGPFLRRHSRTRPREDTKDRDGASQGTNMKSARRTRSRTSRVSTSNASGSSSRRQAGVNHGSGAEPKSKEKGKSRRNDSLRGATASSSIRGVAGSGGSVEAIATDSTALATPFHCDKCSKAFRQRSQLSRHYLRVHERKKPFGCAHCNKHFASAFDRKRHVEAVHGRRSIEFFCDRCSFRSKHERELEEHIRSMHERDHCRLCGKTFKRAANLVAHERHYHSNSNNATGSTK